MGSYGAAAALTAFFMTSAGSKAICFDVSKQESLSCMLHRCGLAVSRDAVGIGMGNTGGTVFPVPGCRSLQERAGQHQCAFRSAKL